MVSHHEGISDADRRCAKGPAGAEDVLRDVVIAGCSRLIKTNPFFPFGDPDGRTFSGEPQGFVPCEFNLVRQNKLRLLHVRFGIQELLGALARRSAFTMEVPAYFFTHGVSLFELS